MTANLVTQQFIPGPRLTDGTDLNTLVAQINTAFGVSGAASSITALNTVGAGTLTAAAITSGFIARGGAQAAAAFTDTTDTAAAILAAWGGSVPLLGSFVFRVENGTNAAETLAGGTGVTLAGNTVLPLLTWADYLVVKTSATAVSMTFVGAGVLTPLPAFASTAFTNTTVATIGPGGFTAAQVSQLAISGGTGKTFAVSAAVDIVAATPNVRVGMTTEVLLRNTSTVTLTLTGLVGTIVSGLTTLLPNNVITASMTIDSLGSTTLAGLTTSQISL